MAHKQQQKQRASLGFAAAVVLAALAAAAAALPGAAAARPLVAPPTPAAPSSPSHYHHHDHYDHHHHHHDESGGGSNVATKGLFGAAFCEDGNPSDPRSDDKVGKWDSNCEDKANACTAQMKPDRCILWTKYAEPARQQQKKFVYTKTNEYRTKIVPAYPVQGLENIMRGNVDAETDLLWSNALVDVNTRAADLTHEVTHPYAYINSLNARTHHQMHIHVGEATSSTFFDCVAAELTTSPPASWKTLKLTSPACDALSPLKPADAKLEIRAKLVKAGEINEEIRKGMPALAKVQGAHFTDDEYLVRTGVLVAPHGKPALDGEYIVFLVRGYHVNDDTIFGNMQQ